MKDSVKRISFEIRQDEHAQIKAFAALKGMSIKGLFMTTLAKTINEQKLTRNK